MRKNYLDGLRGIAAFAVLIFHANVYIAMALPWEVTGLTHSYLMRFFNGNFAVCIFFILSGYVLSLSATKNDQHHHAGELIIKRYFRLTPVVGASILFSYFTWKTVGFYTTQMSSYAPVFNWMAPEYQFKPSFVKALYDGLIGVYTEGTSYNGVLWTIKIELFGSIIIYALIRIFWEYLNFVLIAVLTIIILVLLFYQENSYYFSLFVIGAILCRKTISLHWIFIIPAYYLGSIDQWSNDAVGLFNLIGIKIDSFGKTIPFHAVGAVMLLMCVLSNEGIKAVLSSKIFTILGRLSYSLYAVHVVVIFSIGNLSFIVLSGKFNYMISGVLSLSIVIVVSFFFAYIFTRFIDEPAQKYAGKISRYILNGKYG